MAFRHVMWDGNFKYPGMVNYSTPKDGSCLIHALLMAYNQSYRTERQGNQVVSRKSIVRTLRDELANLLASPVNPLDPQGSHYYDVLGRGNLSQAAQLDPQYSLIKMQATLRSTSTSIDYMFLEFIATILNKDIYILDAVKRDVYMTSDEELYQKGRPSIVVLYRTGHYELIGLQDSNNVVTTLFMPDSAFIAAIQQRQSELATR